MTTIDIEERLNLYLDSISLSVNKLENLCGFSRRYLNNSHFKIPRKKIDVILSILPELNEEWLLNGIGEMTKEVKANEIGIKEHQTLPIYRKGVLDRIEQLLQEEGITTEQFESSHHIYDKTIERCRQVGNYDDVWEWIKIISTAYPRYSLSWIAQGVGEMEKKDSRTIPIIDIYDINQITDFSHKPVEYTENLFPKADIICQLTHLNDNDKPHEFSKSDLLAVKHWDHTKLISKQTENYAAYFIAITTECIFFRYFYIKDGEITSSGLYGPKESVVLKFSEIVELYEVTGCIKYY